MPMLVLSPSGLGLVQVSSAPVPLLSRSWMVTKLTIQPRLGQWSKILAGAGIACTAGNARPLQFLGY